MRTKSIGAVLATGALLMAGVSTALASALPKLPVASGELSSSQFQVKPKFIQISGDGSFYFAGAKKSKNRAGPIKWSSWTASGGRGSGFNWVNNCKPSCARGTFHRYPVKLHAWRAKHVGKRFIFTRMTVTYTNGHPSSIPHKTDVFKVTHRKGGIYLWNYPS